MCFLVRCYKKLLSCKKNVTINGIFQFSSVKSSNGMVCSSFSFSFSFHYFFDFFPYEIFFFLSFFIILSLLCDSTIYKGHSHMSFNEFRKLSCELDALLAFYHGVKYGKVHTHSPACAKA